MTQSNRTCKAGGGALHVAVIMDGNGRWATRRGLPRSAGHRAGVDAVRRVVEAAPALGITKLTLFAFSADNWRRPHGEVAALMRLLRHYLQRDAARLVDSGVRLTVIGRRDRLSPELACGIAAAEAATAQANRLRLRIAIDYSARQAIARAASVIGAGALSFASFGRCVAQSDADDDSPPEVDLMIRTGGERRLSDFLLWESAYAELWFTERMWPDFDGADLAAAVDDFRRRNRRFGGLDPTDPVLAVAAPP